MADATNEAVPITGSGRTKVVMCLVKNARR